MSAYFFPDIVYDIRNVGYIQIRPKCSQHSRYDTSFFFSPAFYNSFKYHKTRWILNPAQVNNLSFSYTVFSSNVCTMAADESFVKPECLLNNSARLSLCLPFV